MNTFMLIATIYSVGYVASAALFTRTWLTNDSCTNQCNVTRDSWGEIRTNYHAPGCNDYRDEPLPAAEAMWYAVFWFACLFHYALAKLHMKPHKQPEIEVWLTNDQLDKITSPDQLERVLRGTEEAP